MALAFLSWKNMSAGFTGVAGAPVTVLPWSNRLALFATDASGVISCAGGDPQNGLMGSWAPISDGFSGVAGAPVTVLPWGNRFALFATDASGVISCAGGDPQNGLMGSWAPISDGFSGVAGAPIAVLPWGNRFALFATDATGTVMTAGGDPQNGLMGSWAPISDAFAGVPGAPVTVLPWGDHFALFATDASGVVSCAGGDPQNGLMGPWAPISDAFAGVPGAPVTVLPWGDHFALFAADATGAVLTAGGDPQNGLMGPWAWVSEDFSGPPGAAVTGVPWAGAFAVCAVDSTGTVCTACGDPQNNLSDWAQAAGLTAKPGSAATILAIGTGVDLFAADTAGEVFTTCTAMLRKVEITFNTLDDDKEVYGIVQVFLKNRLGNSLTPDSAGDFLSNYFALRRYQAAGDRYYEGRNPYIAYGLGLGWGTVFENNSSNTYTLNLFSENMTVNDVVLPQVDIHYLAKGTDRWIFTYTVKLTFDTGVLSFSSTADGVPGIILDEDNRDHTGMGSENLLRTLPVPVQTNAVTNSALTRVTLDFFTHGSDRDEHDNKNDDTRLNVHIVNRVNAQTSHDIIVGLDLLSGEQFPDSGTAYDLHKQQVWDPAPNPIRLADMVLPIVYIVIVTNDEDRWIFDYQVTFEFVDPDDRNSKSQSYSWRENGITLDQSRNKHTGIYQGRPFPTVAPPTAPKLTYAPIQHTGEFAKIISIPLLQRKLAEFVTSRDGLMGPWTPISDAFAGVPGAPVTVLPWGDHFALFATDASGVVSCAGGDPQNGLMGPWAPISDAFAGVPGAPVTVLSWGDHFALFATDASGVVSCAGGDPQNGLMGSWVPISDAFAGVPGAPVTVVPWGDHFALFATDASGVVSCAGGDPQNGLMGSWAPISDAFAGVPGAPVTVLSWGDHFALFATDASGVVSCAGGDPQNGLMGSWAPISDAFAGVPGAPVTVLSWGDHFALFATDASGVVSCAGGDPQNGLMGSWAPISDAFAGVPGAPVTVLPWGDHFALFATDSSRVVGCAGGDPQNGLMGSWAPISDAFAGVPGAPVTVLPWGDHFALFATDASGVVGCAENGSPGALPPLAQLSLSALVLPGIDPDNPFPLPESYIDLQSLVNGGDGNPHYVSSPSSKGQMKKWGGIADSYLDNIDSGPVSISIDTSQVTPFALTINFKPDGKIWVNNYEFLDIHSFSITLNLTVQRGWTTNKLFTVIDFLGWVPEIQNLLNTRTLVQGADLYTYRYTGTFLGQPVDFEAKQSTLESQDIIYGFVEQVVKVSLDIGDWADPGGMIRETIRNKIYDSLTTLDVLTGNITADSINASITSWMLGGVCDDLANTDANNVVINSVKVQSDSIAIDYNGPSYVFEVQPPADWPNQRHHSATYDFSMSTLENIQHIVVLTKENRSFDHMLGYLSLPVENGGMGRQDIDGLKGGESNTYQGKNYPGFPLNKTLFAPGPPNQYEAVHHAIHAINGGQGQMDGFVKSYAESNGDAVAGQVMGYHTAATVPVFDSLARDFAIGHRWFASHPGPTFPNRFYELTGRPNLDARGFWELENSSPTRPVFTPTIFDFLNNQTDPVSGSPVTWRYFEHGYCTLRNYERYTFDATNIVDFEDPQNGFFACARTGNLPSVSFIDPHFVDYPPGSNCDEPPSDVAAGQDLVRRVVEAVVGGPAWPNTLLLIVYDEHGGFYDHVPPPSAPRISPDFPVTTLGLRVPAFVISPWVAPGSVFGNPAYFDHTSILKTIVRRFLSQNPPYLGPRYAAANDLSSILTAQPNTTQFLPFIRYSFQHLGSGWMLDVEEANPAPGTHLRQFSPNLTNAQDFCFEQQANGFAYIRSDVSHLYVTVNPSLQIFQDVKYPASGGPGTPPSQLWKLTQLPSDGGDGVIVEIRSEAYPNMRLRPSDPVVFQSEITLIDGIPASGEYRWRVLMRHPIG